MMEKNVTAEREKYIDVIAGIMIFWMIFGHCSYFSHFQIPLYGILGFYMPWFFYKSGLFFAPKSSGELTKKDAKKLLRTFFIYSVIGWLVWASCGLIDSSLLLRDCITIPIRTFFLKGFIKGNGALWFLLSLFVVRQFSNILINKQIIPLPAIVFVSFALAAVLYEIGWYNYSKWFGNIFSGMCFFVLGYWLKDKEKNFWLLLVSIVFFIFVLSCTYAGRLDGFPYLYMHANKMYSGNYYLFYPTALAGIIVIDNLFHFLCKHIKFNVLNYIGVNSMVFYTTHWILFVFVTFVSKFFFNVNRPFVLFIILLGSSVVFLPLINIMIRSIKSKITKSIKNE